MLEVTQATFTQVVSDEASLTWTMKAGPDGEVVVAAAGSHFNQDPIAVLTTGGNGKPTLDLRLPPDFNGTVYVRKGGAIAFQMVDGELV